MNLSIGKYTNNSTEAPYSRAWLNQLNPRISSTKSTWQTWPGLERAHLKTYSSNTANISVPSVEIQNKSDK